MINDPADEKLPRDMEHLLGPEDGGGPAGRGTGGDVAAAGQREGHVPVAGERPGGLRPIGQVSGTKAASTDRRSNTGRLCCSITHCYGVAVPGVMLKHGCAAPKDRHECLISLIVLVRIHAPHTTYGGLWHPLSGGLPAVPIDEIQRRSASSFPARGNVSERSRPGLTPPLLAGMLTRLPKPLSRGVVRFCSVSAVFSGRAERGCYRL